MSLANSDWSISSARGLAGFALSKAEMALIMGPNCVYFFDSFIFLKLVLEPGQLSLVCSETTCVMCFLGPRTFLWL